ncbi:MAG: lysophospholipid acyltransferase family protein [bacterium]
MSRSLALVRLVALVGMTLCLSAGLALARLGLTLAGYPQRAARIADRVVTLWARGTQRLLGMRIRIDGEIPEEPVAIVANHLGYIDIVALWSVVPGVFVARADVADWPLIGQAGRLIGTIFVDRTRKRDLLRVIPEMQRPLSTGRNVIFFPEGTSSPGREILPFKSSLFEPAVRCGVPVVTASLQLETAPPAAPAARSVCWWGSMTFAPHVFELLQLRSFDARIHFSSPIRPEEDRKALSRAAAESIRKTFIATTSAETETGEARETSIASGVPFSLDVSEPFEPAEAARIAKTSVPESEGGTPDDRTASPARDCMRLLEEGGALLEALADEHFALDPEAMPGATPGAHTRHVIDYVDCLLSGIDAGIVDYTARKRRPEIESDREVALREIDRCCRELESLTSLDAAKTLRVRTDEGEDWTQSSLARELRFVSSHTVHHYSLIRLALSRLGVATPDSYGVSASTLAHRRRQAG